MENHRIPSSLASLTKSALAVAAGLLLLAGCTHVKPYERGKLAHPTMTDDMGGASAEHVYAIHEGAVGGGAPGGGGCGCN